MPVRINGRVIRNIPEQVCKNKKDIKSEHDDIQSLAAQLEALNQKVNDLAAGVYKPQGSATVAQLNALVVDETMNGYVYDVSDSGTLTKGSVSVNAGDNVVIIWSAGDWVWDKLSGIIDLSNYVTLDGNQTITGTKTITADTNLDGSSANYSPKLNFISQQTTGTIRLAYYDFTFNKNIYPSTNGTLDLGVSGAKWKDLYLAGAVNKNSSGYGLTFPDTSSLTANNELIDSASIQTINAKKTFAEGLEIPYGKTITCGGTVCLYFEDYSFRTYSFTPIAANAYDVGSSVRRYKNVFTTNISNGTDSATVKQISDLVAYAIAQGWIS